MPQQSSSLVELLQGRATRQSGKTAFVFLDNGERESDRVTFGELDARARRIAAALQQIAEPGSRALLLYPQGLDFVAAFFGCLYAGLVAVPAKAPGANRRSARLEAILADAEPSVALAPRAICEKTSGLLRDCGSSASWVCTDMLDPALGEAWRPPAIERDQLAFIQYTSGSTSTPKGVMISHANLLHNAQEGGEAWGDSPENVMVTWVPTFHDLGLVYGVIYPVYSGMACYMMAPVAFLSRPFRWLDAISRHRGTHTSAPNFAFDLCLDRITPEQMAQLDLSSWAVTLNAAEPVRASTVARFTERFAACGFNPTTMCPGFGLAEVTMRVTCSRPRCDPLVLRVDPAALGQGRVVESDAVGATPLVGCGPTETDTTLAIVDPQTRRRCAPDVIGEIWVSSRSVAAGYWKRPEDTARTFAARIDGEDAGPYLRTGDLGFVGHGELFVTGRIKDLLIVRGQNHYPQDIELTADGAHPMVRRNSGAAFSVPVDGEERVVVAVEVERTALRALPGPEIVAAIRRAVAEEHDVQLHAVTLVRTGTILKTSSGKIQRQACRHAWLAGELDVVAEWRQAPGAAPSDSPVGSLRGRVRSLAARILRVTAADLDDRRPLADYGMDSLAATTLAAQLGDVLARDLPATLAYDWPSVDALVAHLSGGTRPAASARPARVRVRGEPIAIVGVGCRLPGASSPEAFWDLLRDGVDAIRETPASRWDADAIYDPAPGSPGRTNSRWGGFLDAVDGFDARFFGISPREAEQMDPQHRLLLEVGWEALEDAGLAPDRLAGSSTGVFVGLSTSDYGSLLRDRGFTLHSAAGAALSVAAARLSYLLDLRGPALVIDTACSSSLVAVHAAVTSLRAGDCDLALAGGVNAMLTPDLTIALSQARMLSSSGRCRAFDADADGYVRSEGCGLVALKRLADAMDAGDRVLAVIRGAAINQDGRSNGLTAPSGPAQQAVIARALADADVDPARVSYVEAHGTGTRLGDPIEIQALTGVLGGERPADRPLRVGSVKTNIGHLESAAGIAGLIKVVLALQHREIPRHLHLHAINPHVAAVAAGVRFPIAHEPWLAEEPRIAGVSSFGFSGTNAHVIVEEAPARTVASAVDVDRPVHLLAISGATETAVRALADRYAKQASTLPARDLADFCFSVNTGRATASVRAGLVLPADPAERDFAVEPAVVTAAPRIGFVFGDAAIGRSGAGRALYASHPGFRRSLDRAAAAFDAALAGVAHAPLLDVWFGDRQEPAEQPLYAHAGTLAIGLALGDLWRTWGIVPQAAAGVGVGEIAAACAAGRLEIDAAFALCVSRSRAGAAGAGDTAAARSALAGLDADTVLDLSAVPLAVSDRPARGDSTWHVSLPGGDEWPPLLCALARLHEAGADVDFAGFDSEYPRRRVAAPRYPFERQRYWLPAPTSPAPRVGPLPETDALPESDHLARLTWAPLDAPPKADSLGAGTWIVVDASGSTTGAIASALTGAGERLTRIETRGGRAGDALARALDDVSRRGPVQGVVYDAGLDARTDDAMPADALAAASAALCAEVADLAAALASHGDGAPQPRLWVVTRGAVAAVSGDRVSLTQAPLWGLGRVIANELPDAWGGLVDLDPGEDSAWLLLDALGYSDAADQIAIRGVRLLAPGIGPAPRTTWADARSPGVRADATYLITGGSGGLGPRVAARLVAEGARSLVLLARQPETPRLSALLEPLRRAGAAVAVRTGDVSSAGDLAGVIDWIARERPPLRGVVHAAGVLDDGLIGNLGRSRFDAVFAPKAAGAWHLYRLLGDTPLDWFVLFSSIAALTGSVGQGNYAAANAFLDGMADRRAPAGWQVVTIDWGPWAGAGLTERMTPAYRTRMAAQGVRPMDADAALAIFAAALRGRGQIVCADADWATLAADRPLRQALWRGVRARDRRADVAAETVEELTDAGPQRGWLRARLERLIEDERADQLQRAVQEEIGAVLQSEPGLVALHRGLFDQGLDSLLAMELTARLQHGLDLTLPATLVFQHPTVEKLSAWLLNEARLARPDRRDVPRSTDEAEIAAAALEEIRALSPREIEAAIDRELGSLLP